MLSREAEEFVRAGWTSDLVQDAAGLGRGWCALVRIIRKRVNRGARSARSEATMLRTELEQDDRRVAEPIARSATSGRSKAVVPADGIAAADAEAAGPRTAELPRTEAPVSSRSDAP